MELKDVKSILIKYGKVWLIFTMRTTQIAFTSRLGALLFLLGKSIRFGFFLFLLFAIHSQIKKIGGYSVWEMILFFATYNFIDSISQFFFREVYRFRSHIITGYFDHILTKPISPLLKALLGGSDMLDIPIVVLSIGLIWFSLTRLEGITFFSVLLYILFLCNAIFIALSFHICVLSFGILATVVDNAIMLYRDITQMGRFPIDIYHEPLKSIVTFIVPVGVMMTFPVKVLLNLLSIEYILFSFCIAISFFITSIVFWNYSLKRYSSASS